jgi:hypothetical protein
MVGRIGTALGALAALWFIAAVIVQGARCGGDEGMMLRGQGFIGIVACVLVAEPRDLFLFRGPGRR